MNAGGKNVAELTPALRRNWKPIQDSAASMALKLGHSPITFHKFRGSDELRMGSCRTCYGCCWVAFSVSRGFTAGGRILKYKCGTKEAAGIL